MSRLDDEDRRGSATGRLGNGTDRDSETDSWSPDLYEDKHSFVWKLATPLIQLLAPQPGDRILDVGCGTGGLTAQIAESSGEVVGLDNSPSMIAEARRQHPHIEFLVADAHDFQLDGHFDGVFSNAALHWIKDPNQVAACLSRTLAPHGRVVCEFGGDGNIRHLVAAIEDASRSMIGQRVPHPWYFPSIAGFASVLERHNFEVTQAALIDRPTPLEGEDGLRNWVKMFGQHWLTRIPPDQHQPFFDQVEAVTRKNLHHDSVWHADYRRIRVVAHKRG